MTTNYFKIVTPETKRAGGIFIFFDDRDHGSTSRAYELICSIAVENDVPTDRVSKWRLISNLEGPWLDRTETIGARSRHATQDDTDTN